MQILAFDFGTKKIGVAVGQTSTFTSSPLQVISSKDNKVNWNEIIILLDEWKPELIIVDERLTTFEAKQILEDRNSLVDASAAKILIDNWFEQNKE